MYKYIPVLHKDRICLLYSNDGDSYYLFNNLPDYDGAKPKDKLLIQTISFIAGTYIKALLIVLLIVVYLNTI